MAHLPAVFSNAFQLTFTPDDSCIVFCQRDLDDSDLLHGSLRVYMPIAHMKRLWKGLGRAVESYEKNFGEIVTDPRERLTPEAKEAYEVRVKQRDAQEGAEETEYDANFDEV